MKKHKSSEKVHTGLKEKKLGQAKVLRCGELGIECNFEAIGDTEKDALKNFEEHLRYDHAVHGPEKFIDACLTRKRDPLPRDD